MKLNTTVIIVGAGPAGLGCALALRACGLHDLLILDRDGVGASFERWPAQMRLLTPSFHGNAFGCVDLNAISPDSSPADFLRTEHPTGREYARYLKAIATHYELPVRSGIKVEKVQKTPAGLRLRTSGGVMHARFVIWAAGEFSRPDMGDLEGADVCIHNSSVTDWKDIAPGEQQVAVIGGYESGMDAAINLMQLGKEVHLLTHGSPWDCASPDPSLVLSPSTHDRLKTALLTTDGTLHFHKETNVTAVRRMRHGFDVVTDDTPVFHTSTPPILCTGFRSALEPLGPLLEWDDDRAILSEEADESTLTPGLFYSGPSLRHRGVLFCFIYKFRSRFGIIAREIAHREGLEWESGLRRWKERGFMLEDLSCCNDCQCAVAAEPTEHQKEEPDHAHTV